MSVRDVCDVRPVIHAYVRACVCVCVYVSAKKPARPRKSRRFVREGALPIPHAVRANVQTSLPLMTIYPGAINVVKARRRISEFTTPDESRVSQWKPVEAAIWVV